ncbi:hypothetical protein AMTRI_Chr06g194260 [Amborella trichopoda]
MGKMLSKIEKRGTQGGDPVVLAISPSSKKRKESTHSTPKVPKKRAGGGGRLHTTRSYLLIQIFFPGIKQLHLYIIVIKYKNPIPHLGNIPYPFGMMNTPAYMEAAKKKSNCCQNCNNHAHSQTTYNICKNFC